MEDTIQVMKQAMDMILRLNGIYLVTLARTGQPPSRAEGALSAVTPSAPSFSVAGPT